MKLFNKILLGAAAITVMGAFSSCKEEATLGGADAVYIEMANPSMTLLVGDTIKLEARVSNVSGKTIETPIEWSVGDENVAKIVDIVEYKKVKNPNPSTPAPNPGSPDEGDENGDNTGDGDEQQDPQSRAASYDIVEIHSWGVTAVPGSQGKTTTVKATLENGQFALANLEIGRSTLSGGLTLLSEDKRSYVTEPNDTVWFGVSPISLVDDYELSYEFVKTEVVSEGDIEEDLEFRFPENPLYIDRAGGRVGVVYTAPRIAGKAECTLKLSLKDENGDETESASVKAPIMVCPKISAGFEYEQNGVLIRPVYEEESPSNLKPKYISVTMDVNSSHLIGVCQGIRSGREDDIRNAMKAEEAGYFKWNLEGSSLVVEDIFFDTNYTSGYVTYLKVRSGVRSGSARATFTMPDYEPFVCDITVEDYNTVHPVEGIVVKNALGEEIGDTYDAYLGSPMALDIVTDPDASFSYHIPEVTSSDPSIVEVVERDPEAGYTRMFKLNKLGSVVLTIKSLDVIRTVNVTVHDAIQSVDWDNNYTIPSKMIPGSSTELHAGVRMYSDFNNLLTTYDAEVVWTSSDPSIATVEADPSNNLIGIVNAVAEGEVTISATINGFPLSTSILVEALQGTTYTNDMGNTDGFYFIVDESYGANTIQIDFTDHSEYFDLPFVADFATHYQGSDGIVTLGESDPIEGVDYNITVTDNGNGTVTVNGTFTINGVPYTFSNLVCDLQQY